MLLQFRLCAWLLIIVASRGSYGAQIKLPPCTSGVLGILVPQLSNQAPIRSFCSSKYPQPPVTSTTTAPAITSTTTTTAIGSPSTTTVLKTTTSVEIVTDSMTSTETITATETETTTTTTRVYTATSTICNRDFFRLGTRKRDADTAELDVELIDKRQGGYQRTSTYHAYPTTQTTRPYTTTTKRTTKKTTTAKTTKSITKGSNPTYPTTTPPRTTSIRTTSTTSKGDVLTSLSSLKSSIVSSLCSCIVTRTTTVTTTTPSTTTTVTSTITPTATTTSTVTVTSTVTSAPVSTSTSTTTSTLTETSTVSTLTYTGGATSYTNSPAPNVCGCSYNIQCRKIVRGQTSFTASRGPNNALECAQLCDSEPRCVQANYAYQISLCSLYDTVSGNIQDDPDFAVITRLSDGCTGPSAGTCTTP